MSNYIRDEITQNGLLSATGRGLWKHDFSPIIGDAVGTTTLCPFRAEVGIQPIGSGIPTNNGSTVIHIMSPGNKTTKQLPGWESIMNMSECLFPRNHDYRILQLINEFGMGWISENNTHAMGQNCFIYPSPRLDRWTSQHLFKFEMFALDWDFGPRIQICPFHRSVLQNPQVLKVAPLKPKLDTGKRMLERDMPTKSCRRMSATHWLLKCCESHHRQQMQISEVIISKQTR